MRGNPKESTVVAELIRQALDLMVYKLNNRPLHKGEILGSNTVTGARIILRGNTNFTRDGWAIYSGNHGDWQCELNHNRFLRGTPKGGTPKVVALSAATRAMLDSIPTEAGLYHVLSDGLGYRAEEITLAVSGEVGETEPRTEP